MFRLIKVSIWYGTMRSGETCSGVEPEQDAQMLRLRLLRRAIFLRDIRRSVRLVIERKIKSRHLLFFTRETARLLQGGLPLVQIMGLLATNTEHQSLRRLIEHVRMSIENGYAFSEALERGPTYLGRFHRCLIALGERTSTLDLMLLRVAAHLEKNMKFQRALLTTLFYPSTVILVSIVVFVALLAGAVPQFEQLFAEVGAQLPWLTRLVILISHGVESSVLAIGLFLFVFIACFIVLKKKYAVISKGQDHCLLKLPFIKRIVSYIITARFSRALATALSSGLPLLDALHIIAELTKNVVYKSAILASCELMRDGESFHHALSKQQIFPLDFIQMVRLGEISGGLDNMLAHVADLYEERLDYFLCHLCTFLEPALMVVLGVLIGGLIIAMYLPMFKLGSVI